jgi:hypothetical protein
MSSPIDTIFTVAVNMDAILMQLVHAPLLLASTYCSPDTNTDVRTSMDRSVIRRMPGAFCAVLEEQHLGTESSLFPIYCSADGVASLWLPGSRSDADMDVGLYDYAGATRIDFINFL